jgi:hypothetical protein
MEKGGLRKRIEPCDKLVTRGGSIACGNGHKHSLLDFVASALGGDTDGMDMFRRQLSQFVWDRWAAERAEAITKYYKYDPAKIAPMPEAFKRRLWSINDDWGLIPVYVPTSDRWYLVEDSHYGDMYRRRLRWLPQTYALMNGRKPQRYTMQEVKEILGVLTKVFGNEDEVEVGLLRDDQLGGVAHAAHIMEFGVPERPLVTIFSSDDEEWAVSSNMGSIMLFRGGSVRYSPDDSDYKAKFRVTIRMKAK